MAGIALTPSDVSEEFPHGALVIDEAMGNHYNIVRLEAKEDGDKLIILGWAFPNKDFYFDATDAEERVDGWVVTRNGGRCLLRPLSADDEAKTLHSMEAMG